MAAALEQASGCLALPNLWPVFLGTNYRALRLCWFTESFREFSPLDRSSPSVTETSTPRLQIFQYIKQIPSPKDVSAPPVLDGELFQKLNYRTRSLMRLGLGGDSLEKSAGLYLPP